MFKFAFEFVDEFITVSSDLKDWMTGEFAPKQLIHPISSLLPISASIPSPNDFPEVREALRRHPISVCSIGVFTKAYGFHHAAQAVEELRKREGKQIGLILVDGKFAVDPSYRQEVLRGREWITVLSCLEHDKALALLKGCRALIRAVEMESLGLARIEALWCGTPVVATPVGATRGMNLFHLQHPEELNAQLHRVLNEHTQNEVRVWAQHYREEAQSNWTSLKKVLFR